MDSLVVSRTGAVAEIVFDDGKANAFNPTSIERFHAVLDEIEADRAIGAVVLAGRDGFFSGGLDLKILPTLETGALRATLERFTVLMDRLFLLPRPMIAAVGGHALAGGALLALCADVRIAAQGPYRFGTNEVAIGIAMPDFGVEIARASVPPASLNDVLLHGKVFGPDEAVARGIFESVHEPASLRGVARARADELSKLPSSAYATTKMRLRARGRDTGAGDDLTGFVAAVQRLPQRR